MGHKGLHSKGRDVETRIWGTIPKEKMTENEQAHRLMLIKTKWFALQTFWILPQSTPQC